MRKLRLLKIYALICCFTVIAGAEFLLSQMTGSLVLLLDSYHNLFTLLSLVLLVISHRLQDSVTIKNTFGWIRIEILGTLFNLIFFAALLFSIFAECIQTLCHSDHEDVIPAYPLILVISGTAGIFLYIVLQVTVGDLMKNDGCYLSITGGDVMVNRIVTDPEDGLMTANSSTDVNHDPDGRTDACTSATAAAASGCIINRKKGSVTSVMMEKMGKKNTRNSSHDLDPNNDEEIETLKAKEKAQESGNNNNNNETGVSGRRKLLTAESRMQIRHMVRDFGTCCLLVVSGLIVIYDTDHSLRMTSIADALLGMFAVTLLYVTIYPKMKESGYILLQTIPKHIDVVQLKSKLMSEFPDSVLSIHDLHVWCHTSNQIIATCHVTIRRSSMSSYGRISRSIEKFFVREGISSATIQPEFFDDSEGQIRSSYPCLYMCSNTKSDCHELKCCHETSDECEAVISASHAT